MQSAMIIHTIIWLGIATAVPAASAIHAAIEYLRSKDHPEKRQFARKVIEKSALWATISGTMLLLILLTLTNA